MPNWVWVVAFVAAVNADAQYGRWLYRPTKKTTDVSGILTAAGEDLKQVATSHG